MLSSTRFAPLFAAVAALWLTPPAGAQSFNVDLFGFDATTIPSSAFGGGALQPGQWNAFNCPGFCDDFVLPLLGLNGAPSSVVCHMRVSENSFACATGLPAGDLDALLGTGMQFSGTFTDVQADFEGLTPGTYDVYFHASGCGTTVPATIAAFGSAGTAGQWTNISATAGPTLVDGQNYGRIRVRVESEGRIGFIFTANQNLRAHGVQIVKREGSIQPLCFGTNTHFGTCPCGTAGGWERGCPSSLQPLGAALQGSGATQVSADSLQIVANDVSNSLVTIFQGTTFATQFGVLGTSFGDGLRCAGGSVIRIVTKAAVSNTLIYPEAGEISLSVRGSVGASGGLRVYQAWYRNAADFCTSATFNLTNGLSVEWTP